MSDNIEKEEIDETETKKEIEAKEIKEDNEEAKEKKEDNEEIEKKPEAADEPDSDQSNNYELNRAHVLVIDDEEETLEVFKKHLWRDFRVTLKNSGRKAIEFLNEAENDRVDIIVLDIEMPVMNGFDTLLNIRKISSCAGIPVIFSTGRGDREAVLSSLGKGADGYMVKPIEKQRLIGKINEILDDYRTRKVQRDILVVDDDLEYLRSVKRQLQGRYNITVLSSGKTALEYLRMHTPDMMLLDYNMPLYNGLNIINMMRQREESKNIPVIMVTCMAERDIVIDCLKSELSGFLLKPLTKDRLIAKIEEVFQERESE